MQKILIYHLMTKHILFQSIGSMGKENINMDKRICFFIIIIIAVALISGCDKTPSNPLMKHHLKLLNSVNEEEYAIEYFQNVISYIEERDKNKLKELFTKNIQETNQSLSEDIEYLYELFEGTVVYISEIYGPMTETEAYDGKEISIITCYFEVTTDKDEYLIFLKICNIDSSDNKNIGLQMLQIIRQEDEDILFDWGGPKTDCKGVYRPDKVQSNTTE